MSKHAVLISTVKVRAGSDAEFATWKTRHDLVVGKFVGFVSSDIIPPSPTGGNEWTIILNFASQDELDLWEKSPERAGLVAEGLPLFEGGNLGEVARPVEGVLKQDGNVTEVIFSKVKTGMEDAYRAWSVRIQAAQAKHPGYQGMYLQPPEEKGGLWTTIIRFETAAHLEGWMAAPERKELLRESKAFIEHEQLTRLATSFPGWVPVNPETGKGPPDWKTALLVLLGLFPVVMLEMKFLSPVLTGLGLHASLATFIGNCGSVAITSFVTMPLFVRWFGWWLFLKDEDDNRTTTFRGVAVLVVLFAIEVAAFWNLLTW